MARDASAGSKHAISIQARIAAAAVGAAVGVLCLAATAFFFVQWGESALDLQRGERALAKVSADQVGHEIEAGRAPDFAVASLAPAAGLRRASFVDAQGRAVARYSAADLRAADRLTEARAPVVVRGLRRPQ